MSYSFLHVQLNTPLVAATLLKNILEAVVYQVYKTTVSISTEVESSAYYSTHISSKAFHHKYKTAMPVTAEEAEANSIYRFLKYTTNVLGYTIVDENFHVLSRIVSKINSCNILINELQIYVNRAVNMMQQVHKDIIHIYGDMESEVPRTTLGHIHTLVDNLFTSIEHYHSTAKHGAHTFEQHKVQ
jgi:hypothetical protein